MSYIQIDGFFLKTSYSNHNTSLEISSLLTAIISQFIHILCKHYKGSMAAIRMFFEMLKLCIAFAHRVITNQHFKSTLLGGRDGVSKKSTLCMLLIMWTIVDDPY